MSFLLDTNVVSELRKGRRANSGATSWAASVLEDQVFLSVITWHEIERGILSSEQRARPEAVILRSWFEDELKPGYATRTLPVSGDIALKAAAFEVRRTVELADHLIAATALVHGLTLVTRNTSHFMHTGVPLLNPFT